MTGAQCVQEYLQRFLDEIGKSEKWIGVDFLGPSPGNFAVLSVPAEGVLRRYLDGSSLRQFNFVFASRAVYSEDILDTISNLGLFEDLADWLESNTRRGDLPKMGEGKTAKKIEALNSGYLMDAEGGSGSYQIQCRLIYKKKGER